MSKNFKNKIAEGGTIAVIIILILALGYGLSWIATCGIIKLITLCFGWTFKWSIATGIWLVLCILKEVFTTTVKSKQENVLMDYILEEMGVHQMGWSYFY